MKHCTCAPSRSVRKRTRCNRSTRRHSRGGTVLLRTAKEGMTIVFPPQIESTTNPTQKEFLNTIFEHIVRNPDHSTKLAKQIKNLCEQESQKQLKWVAPIELYRLCVKYAKTINSELLKNYMYILNYSYRGYDVIKGKHINNSEHMNIPLSNVFSCGHDTPPKTVCDNPLKKNSSNRSPLQPLNVNMQDENVQNKNVQQENVQPKKSYPSIADRRRSKRKASKTQKKALRSHYPSMSLMR